VTGQGPGHLEQELPPRAAVLVESLRDLGYSVQTAVADIVDNSISAGARNIEILAAPHGVAPAIAVLDDGAGMARDELLEAMRPGSRSPLDERATTDLGRFGLGLKTASFSQCRKLTVLSRRDGAEACAVWDLDLVCERDRWVVSLPGDTADVRWSERLGSDGTLVLWERLDRLATADEKLRGKDLVRQLDETASHLEFVFHRYLGGRKGRIGMSLNGRTLKALDPFASRHPATQHHPGDVFELGEQKVRIQPFTLPHRDKVTLSDWRRFAGPEGYLKNQGFYLYRNRRLIVHGTWFGLAPQQELTKFARVAIDIPNTMDSAWKIDVRKASAQPPAPVRRWLKGIVEQLGGPSKRVVLSRGRRLTEESLLPVWVRNQSRSRISYDVNADHPLIEAFTNGLEPPARKEFRRVIDFVSSALPVGALHADESAGERLVGGSRLGGRDVAEAVTTVWRAWAAAGVSRFDREEILRTSEPFRSRFEEAVAVIEDSK